MKYWIYTLTLFAIAGACTAVADAPAGPPPARVKLEQVQEKMVARNTPVVGTLYFDRASVLAMEVAGIVQSVAVRAGERIKQGDSLLVLNTDFIDKEIALVKTRISQIDVQLEKADKDLKRYELLFRQQAASEQAYDDILFARRELVIRRDALSLELATAMLKKDKSTLRAPYSGVLLERSVDVGNYVSPGTVCFRLGSLEDVYIKVPVTENLLKYAQSGTALEVTINALNEEMTGILDGFLPVADIMTRNIMLKVKIPAPSQVAENMSATVHVAVSPPAVLKMVPRDALVSLQGQDFVYTINDGKAMPVPVQILSYVGRMAAVASEPLLAGMDVIVEGAARLRPEQAVLVLK